MKSFDVKILNNSVQFQDMFSRTITALVDFHRHVVCLDNLLEDFYESVENYNYEICMPLGQPNLKKQSVIHQTLSSIGEASEIGTKLVEETHMACRELLRLFLNCSQERQKSLLGFAIPIPAGQVDRFISIFFVLLVDKWIGLGVEELEEIFQTEKLVVMDIIEDYSLHGQLFLSCLGSKETIRMADLSDDELAKDGIYL